MKVGKSLDSKTNLNFNNLNSSGQGEMVFRLMIGVIMGLAILVTVMSLINFFSQQQVAISEQRLYDGFMIALENPVAVDSEDLVVQENVKLEQGTYSAYTFSYYSGTLLPDCVRLMASANFEPGDSPGTIEVLVLVETTVYYKCISQPNDDDCPICCIVSFAKKIAPSESCS